MSHILINGSFFCRNLTGIERFAFEVCKRLDLLLDNKNVSILLPENTDLTKVPAYKNIQILKSNKSCKVFPIWEHFYFSNYAKKIKAIPLDFANATPFFYPGIVFVHDIYAKSCPTDFTSKKDRLIRMYDCLMYHHAAKKAKKLITVSDFSKKQIANTYHISEDKIEVIYNGWEHFKEVEEDDSVFAKFSNLKKSEYFFTLGSLSKRKNLAWIAKYAEKHPQSIFAVSGKAISGLVAPELEALQTLNNVILLGYVSDGNVKSLMKNCKAFIFPSYYEGFGIPPLEALSCNAKIIISKASCLPELYKTTAHYIDPTNTDCDLDKILLEPVENAEKVLKTYSYDKAAEKLYNILKDYF